MRSPTPYRSAISLPALFALLLTCVAGTYAQTAPNAPGSDAPAPTASVQLAPLPNTAQFSQKVDFRTRPAGESLDALIQILARSVGLSAITQGIPEDAVVRYDLGEPKPFREVWDIVLTLNGLEYVLRGNGIVVVGPPATLAGLRPSQKQGAPSTIRTYAVSTDATELQALLESQFPARSGVSVSAFENLGLVSVRGTPAQQARVETILSQFDRSAATPVRRAYTLSYASAEVLAEVLTATVTAPEGDGGTSFSTAQQPTQTGAGNATRQALTDSLTAPETAPTTASTQNAAATVAQGQFSIAADARSNRIIVTAPADVQRDIAALIAELDQPERQVNVQVRIQEVTTDATERLGIDLSAALGNFATTLFSGDVNSGLSFVFDGQRAVSGLNLGAVLDAFERQNLARRVDDSNLTVLNNGEATLQSGGVIYITLAGNGSVENVEREIPYGVQLDLSPQITNNNEVVLTISGRVDAILSELTDPSLLNVSTRNLTSQVKLAPGQSVVLGGLLQNELTDTTRQLPVLGDVPIVGNLFSNSTSEETNTELLVIVTASVLE